MTRQAMFNLVALLAYAVMVISIVWSLHRVRREMLASSQADAQQQAWRTWRDDVRERQATGAAPVKRRVPKSIEPNLTVLLRDYYGTCLTGAVFFCSLLFWVLWFLLRGVLAARE